MQLKSKFEYVSCIFINNLNKYNEKYNAIYIC